MGILGIKSENLHCGIGEPLEAAENHLGLERNRLVAAEQLALERAHSSLDLLHLLENLGAAGRTYASLVAESLGNVIDGTAANVRETVHTLQLRVQERLLVIRVVASNVEGGAVNAYAVQDLDGVVQELVEVDRAGQGNMSEVSLALQVRVLAGRANLPALDHAQTSIKDTARNRVVSLMGLVGCDLYHRTAEDFLGGGNTELDTHDRHCILIRLSRNIFSDPF